MSNCKAVSQPASVVTGCHTIITIIPPHQPWQPQPSCSQGAHLWRAGVQSAKEMGVRHQFTLCWAALQPILDWDGLVETERERCCDGGGSCSSRLHYEREADWYRRIVHLDDNGSYENSFESCGHKCVVWKSVWVCVIPDVIISHLWDYWNCLSCVFLQQLSYCS